MIISTCHWCHVMAHESFEDQEVAALLNDHFIAVKVDREERPDVDSIYMKVCQMITQQGGWPLNVFLTPDQKPFFAGTYFPKTSMMNRPGFMDVLQQLSTRFEDDRDHVENVANNIMRGLKQNLHVSSDQTLSPSILHKTFQQLAGSFDTVYGGFGQAPKFPTPHMLTFLLRYYKWSENENALYMVRKTLGSLANGGIYDHIGSGFSRYSTDPQWLVPHFEKMLYDNALLIHAYAEGYQMVKDMRYREIVEDMVTFLDREMTGEQGAFYSAIDADCEGIEGKYYVWSKEEIERVLPEREAKMFIDVYNIRDEGNFEGANIPHLIYTEIDKKVERYGDNLFSRLEDAKSLLLAEREKRIYPHVDDKILASWNGLMISALAKAGRVFDRNDYISRAKRALAFIEDKMILNDRLMVRYRDGEVKEKGFVDDYAYLLWAYMELYQATLSLDYLEKAQKLSDELFRLFWDEEHGGFYFSANDGEELIAREKESYDGALPSGNGVAVTQLLKLAKLTGNQEILKYVHRMFQTFEREVTSYGSGHAQFLHAFLELQMDHREIVIRGSKDDQDVRDLVSILQKEFLPEVAYLVVEDGAEVRLPFIEDYQFVEGKTTVYNCANFACERPTHDVKEVIDQLLQK
ncbi:thioredoxin domain-containing protein [Priestia koreensis]|nr:thioredoxin domain-containing protein [Priestia koreensis]